MKLTVFEARHYRAVMSLLSPLGSVLAWFTVIIPVIAFGMFAIFFTLMVTIDTAALLFHLFVTLPLKLLEAISGSKGDGAHTHT